MMHDMVVPRALRRHRIALPLRVGLRTLLFTIVITAHDTQPALTAPLKLTECLRDWNDREEARGKGVEKLMSDGPMAALSNMTKPQLELIRNYLTLSENLKFRCPGFTPTPRPNPPPLIPTSPLD